MTTAQDDREPLVMTFDGTSLGDGVFIASQTNPWIEVDGVAVTWPREGMLAAPGNDCECRDQPVPGALTGMDSEIGIQRCDECQRFPGDLEAAFAVAQLIGGVVRFEVEPPEEEEE